MYRFIMIQKFPEKKLMTADNAVFQIMRFLNEKSSDEKVTVMNCGGYHYTGEKIIGVLRRLLDERYSNMISCNCSNVKSFDYFKDGITYKRDLRLFFIAGTF